MALLPLTLAAFMAFHVYYLINLGIQLPILLSHNLDFDLLRRLIITVPAESTYLIQQVAILMGLAGSLTIIYLLGRVNHPDRTIAVLGMVPHMIIAVLLAYCLSASLRSFLVHRVSPYLTL